MVSNLRYEPPPSGFAPNFDPRPGRNTNFSGAPAQRSVATDGHMAGLARAGLLAALLSSHGVALPTG